MQSLGVIEPESGLPIQDLEDDEEDAGANPDRPRCQPEWSLISPAGLMASLQVITIVFTQVSLLNNCNIPRYHDFFQSQVYCS